LYLIGYETVGNAIQLAAQNTLDDARDRTLTEDIVNALKKVADEYL
jgi:hypothetical protein